MSGAGSGRGAAGWAGSSFTGPYPFGQDAIAALYSSRVIGGQGSSLSRECDIFRCKSYCSNVQYFRAAAVLPDNSSFEQSANLALLFRPSFGSFASKIECRPLFRSSDDGPLPGGR